MGRRKKDGGLIQYVKTLLHVQLCKNEMKLIRKRVPWHRRQLKKIKIKNEKKNCEISVQKIKLKDAFMYKIKKQSN